MKADFFENPLTHNVRDFARQIWLAGLGAFARAQDEGGKFFETLVQEGQAVDARMEKTANEQTELMKSGVETVKDKVGEIREKPVARGISWRRCSRRGSHGRCAAGVPAREDIQQLFQQVEMLSQSIQELTVAAEVEARIKKVRALKAPESATAAKVAESA